MKGSNPKTQKIVAPGATIGILGSGQLGRMMALAAAPMGYRVHVFSPDSDSPCGQVATEETIAGYDDVAALTAFARAVDVVTYEFENIPDAALDVIEALENGPPIRPGRKSLNMTQDRVSEKTFLNENHVVTAPWRAVESTRELKTAIVEVGAPAVIKSARFGYDGKAQARIDTPSQAQEAYDKIGRSVAILEKWVGFRRELSVVLARGLKGEIVAFPPVENRHENHILRETIAPASLNEQQHEELVSIAMRVAAALDHVGTLAVEFFEDEDGKFLVNEVAPRPHNSGHWTIDACPTSQFEQHIRAVCGLQLGNAAPGFSARMTNILGDEIKDWAKHAADSRAKLHLYGKAEARPGRKMGHVTRLDRQIGTN